MIIGLGSDLCNIERIQASLDRFGERFEDRVFTDAERAWCEARGHGRAESYAARFAAKEAARLIAVVVFPTPPFWLVMAMTLATGLNPITKCSTWNIRN